MRKAFIMWLFRGALLNVVLSLKAFLDKKSESSSNKSNQSVKSLKISFSPTWISAASRNSPSAFQIANCCFGCSFFLF